MATGIPIAKYDYGVVDNPSGAASIRMTPL